MYRMALRTMKGPLAVKMMIGRNAPTIHAAPAISSDPSPQSAGSMGGPRLPVRMMHQKRQQTGPGCTEPGEIAEGASQRNQEEPRGTGHIYQIT